MQRIKCPVSASPLWTDSASVTSNRSGPSFFPDCPPAFESFTPPHAGAAANTHITAKFLLIFIAQSIHNPRTSLLLIELAFFLTAP
jgi:hypothetical protein